MYIRLKRWFSKVKILEVLEPSSICFDTLINRVNMKIYSLGVVTPKPLATQTQILYVGKLGKPHSPHFPAFHNRVFFLVNSMSHELTHQKTFKTPGVLIMNL